MRLARETLPNSLTIAVVILALFPPVFLVVPVLLRFLAVGRIASGAAAMTLLFSVARLLGFVTFIGAHISAPDLTPLWNLSSIYLAVTAS